MCLHLLLLQYYFVSSFVCNAVAFVEEPSGGRLDGYCGRILRAQTQGTRRDGHHEFKLRVEGDPETYRPGSSYRGTVGLFLPLCAVSAQTCGTRSKWMVCEVEKQARVLLLSKT